MQLRGRCNVTAFPGVFVVMGIFVLEVWGTKKRRSRSQRRHGMQASVAGPPANPAAADGDPMSTGAARYSRKLLCRHGAGCPIQQHQTPSLPESQVAVRLCTRLLQLYSKILREIQCHRRLCLECETRLEHPRNGQFRRENNV